MDRAYALPAVLVMTGSPIEGVWATPAAREMFSQAELDDAVEDYNENGPQFVTDNPRAGFAFYEYPENRVLLVAVSAGKATLMTADEYEEARGAPRDDSR